MKQGADQTIKSGYDLLCLNIASDGEDVT